MCDVAYHALSLLVQQWEGPGNEARLSLGSGTDTQEANESKAKWPSSSETGLIPAPYIFQPSDTKSDSSAATSCDDSKKTDIQICHGKKTNGSQASHINICLISRLVSLQV